MSRITISVFLLTCQLLISSAYTDAKKTVPTSTASSTTATPNPDALRCYNFAWKLTGANLTSATLPHEKEAKSDKKEPTDLEKFILDHNIPDAKCNPNLGAGEECVKYTYFLDNSESPAFISRFCAKVVDQRGNKPYKRCSRSKENTTQTEVCFCDKSNLCNTSQAMEFDKYFLLLMASVVALTK